MVSDPLDARREALDDLVVKVANLAGGAAVAVDGSHVRVRAAGGARLEERGAVGRGEGLEEESQRNCAWLTRAGVWRDPACTFQAVVHARIRPKPSRL